MERNYHKDVKTEDKTEDYFISHVTFTLPKKHLFGVVIRPIFMVLWCFGYFIPVFLITGIFSLFFAFIWNAHVSTAFNLSVIGIIEAVSIMILIVLPFALIKYLKWVFNL